MGGYVGVKFVAIVATLQTKGHSWSDVEAVA
jgi:hypothetical protein